MGLFIELSIELTHSNTFGVKDMGADFIEGLYWVIFKMGKSSLEYFIVRGFASSSGSNKHETVSDLNGIIELEDFINKCLNRL
jgi:hypothetical protein